MKIRTLHNRWLVIFAPYFWMFLFLLLPLFIALKSSFSETVYAIPPLRPLLEWPGEKILILKVHLGNYALIFQDQFYISSFLTSLRVSFISTFFCLILGYSLAYGLSRVRPSYRTLLVWLLMVPFFTSFLIRVYSWISILGREGLVNTFLKTIGLIDLPLEILYTNTAVTIGIVYCYLPFMTLPIYANLLKIEEHYREAAASLGAKPFQTFWRITFPLSLPGVVAGCILVFIPAVGEFVIPELLGDPENILIGRVIWLEFFENLDWPLTCALALVLLLIFVIPLVLLQRLYLKYSIQKV